MGDQADVVRDLTARFGAGAIAPQSTRDGVATCWIPPDRAPEVLRFLKTEVDRPYRMLFDLSAIDERERVHRDGQPPSDFTVVYHLLSFDRNEHVRLKVALRGDAPALRTVTDLWASAGWYEREAWDLFGVRFDGHADLRRILMPPDWDGHPLRKEHPARATDMAPYRMTEAVRERSAEAMRSEAGLDRLRRRGGDDGAESVLLNVGPQHPGTHGIFRLVLRLDEEEILDVVPDIGFHHRAAEKMGERQSWHTYIPYTDRVDYLGGVMNNLPYVLAVERLAGIEVPERARVIRVMLCELFRVASHLVWYGTFAQDLGQLSPVFYMFTDRERLFEIVEAITGGRMHPAWFRIGGVAADLPDGWDDLVRRFLAMMSRRLDEYDALVMENPLVKARAVGIGSFTTAEAVDWGVTGPMLRATGLAWDFRKARPYSGYDQFDFDVPTGSRGDCYDRAVVRVAEMRQSLRIVGQCLDRMPPGPYKADHPLTTPPRKERTMHDIETLIHHFLGVSWGPAIPPGEVLQTVEATKGLNGYYLISDGGTMSYRTRIRTPSFPHLQILPWISRGLLVPDLIAILGSIDYVMSDVDR